VDKQQHNSHQAVTYEDLNRISTMTDKRIFDEVLHRMLFAATTDIQLADTESGCFPPAGTGDDAQLLVKIGAGGLRQTGVGMKITTGLGFRKMSAAEQPDDDLPLFVPMFGAAEKTFTLDNSDPVNPRIDEIYMKPAETPGNSQTVKVIDPTTENITDESRDTNQAYDYDYDYRTGTPAGSPVGPGEGAGYTASDKICSILVSAGSGALDPADITDERELVNVDPELVPGVTSLDAANIDLTPNVEGQDNAQDALEALEDAVSLASPTGVNIGQLEYVSPGVVQIAPGVGGVVKIEVNGVIREQSGALTFTLPGLGTPGQDLDTGNETASTPYYLYVRDFASALDPIISAEAPQDTDGAKPGYQLTQNTWRCVGSFWNNMDGNITTFRMSRGGKHTFLMHENDGDHTHWNNAAQDDQSAIADPPAVAESTAWQPMALRIPLTAMEVFLSTWIDDGSGRSVVFYAASNASTTLSLAASEHKNWLKTTTYKEVLYVITSGGPEYTPIMEFPIEDRTAPAIAIGITQAVGSALDNHEILVRGYRDMWAPNLF